MNSNLLIITFNKSYTFSRNASGNVLKGKTIKIKVCSQSGLTAKMMFVFFKAQSETFAD